MKDPQRAATTIVLLVFFAFIILLAGRTEDFIFDYSAFYAGIPLGLAILLSRFSYFKVHYLKALFVFIVAGACHYIAVYSEAQIQKRVLESAMDISASGDTAPYVDRTLEIYLAANAVAITIFIGCLSMVIKWRKLFWLYTFAASFLATWLMYHALEYMREHFHFHHGEALVIAFALWQMIVGPWVSVGIMEEEKNGESQPHSAISM